MAAATAEDILDAVAGELQIPREHLKPEAPLAPLDIASLDMVAVEMALEQRFDVALEPADLHGVDTLEQFLALVLRKADAA